MENLFEFIRVDDDATREEVFRLRHKVYVEEWGFERAEDHPHGIESDQFDSNSVHFMARRREDGQAIGTIRLILHSEAGFPMFRHCEPDEAGKIFLAGLEMSKGAEISRLAVSKEYRRRASDKYFDGRSFTDRDIDDLWDSRRRFENNIVIGLYRRLYMESLSLGLTHLYAVMARGLYLIMRKMGIVFNQIGPEVDYHGLRTPYAGEILKMLEGLRRHNPELSARFVEGMELGSR